MRMPLARSTRLRRARSASRAARLEALEVGVLAEGANADVTRPPQLRGVEPRALGVAPELGSPGEEALFVVGGDRHDRAEPALHQLADHRQRVLGVLAGRQAD